MKRSLLPVIAVLTFPNAVNAHPNYRAYKLKNWFKCNSKNKSEEVD